jgi:hypothetical protein
VGVIAGFIGSFLALELLPALGLSLQAAGSLKVFGGLVGVVSGAVLGSVLWLLAPRGLFSA